MKVLLEILYHGWVTEAEKEHYPQELWGDPIKMQGLHGFEEGLKLGLCLAVFALMDEAI